MDKMIESLRGKLIVSCQALSNEPLHSSYIMGRMAVAARMGGAKGIRANTKEDIQAATGCKLIFAEDMKAMEEE